MKVSAILKLNRDFYQSNAKAFSKTRQSAWPGWQRLVPFLHKINPSTVLDLGCGNGRFFGFLLKNGFSDIRYEGWDTNEIFLAEARNRNPTGKFIEKEAILLDPETRKFDVVCAFGLTHHLPKDLQKQWFETVGKKVNDHGLLILTFWQYSDSAIKEKLSEQEALLHFAQSTSPRFCYKYAEGDLENIIKTYQIQGFDLLDKYESDGNNQKSNRYLILSKRG